MTDLIRSLHLLSIKQELELVRELKKLDRFDKTSVAFVALPKRTEKIESVLWEFSQILEVDKEMLQVSDEEGKGILSIFRRAHFRRILSVWKCLEDLFLRSEKLLHLCERFTHRRVQLLLGLHQAYRSLQSNLIESQSQLQSQSHKSSSPILPPNKFSPSMNEKFGSPIYTIPDSSSIEYGGICLKAYATEQHQLLCDSIRKMIVENLEDIIHNSPSAFRDYKEKHKNDRVRFRKTSLKAASQVHFDNDSNHHHLHHHHHPSHQSIPEKSNSSTLLTELEDTLGIDPPNIETEKLIAKRFFKSHLQMMVHRFLTNGGLQQLASNILQKTCSVFHHCKQFLTSENLLENVFRFQEGAEHPLSSSSSSISISSSIPSLPVATAPSSSSPSSSNAFPSPTSYSTTSTGSSPPQGPSFPSSTSSSPLLPSDFLPSLPSFPSSTSPFSSASSMTSTDSDDSDYDYDSDDDNEIKFSWKAIVTFFNIMLSPSMTLPNMGLQMIQQLWNRRQEMKKISASHQWLFDIGFETIKELIDEKSVWLTDLISQNYFEIDIFMKNLTKLIKQQIYLIEAQGSISTTNSNDSSRLILCRQLMGVFADIGENLFCVYFFHLKEFPLKYSDLKWSGELLGQGSYGYVQTATYEERKVAVKMLKQPKFRDFKLEEQNLM